MRLGPWLAISTLPVMGVLVSSTALADHLMIKHPGQHPDYSFEAEPHLLLENFDGSPGLGFRGTIEIVDNGFVKPINNTVGISFGGDFTHNHVHFPVAMQWNFWLSQRWSVFGEPGVVLHGDDRHLHLHPDLMIDAGGRFHFNDSVSLTIRLGLGGGSVGVSFFL
ncbi:MAG TPA: hypothetical protein VHM70_31605 [Polyangiaceae bacterium]|jgi:hypothetical protein|nr:hypothetical protein [Polyangiaceae bacterium]